MYRLWGTFSFEAPFRCSYFVFFASVGLRCSFSLLTGRGLISALGVGRVSLPSSGQEHINSSLSLESLSPPANKNSAFKELV